MPNVLPFAKRVRIVASLVEGCSLRATERLCEVSHETVINQAVAIGEACRRLHNALMRGLRRLHEEHRHAVHGQEPVDVAPGPAPAPSPPARPGPQPAGPRRARGAATHH